MGRQDDSRKPTDFQVGEPVGKLAELVVNAEMLGNAVKLRVRAEEIAKKVATPESLKSKEARAAALRKIASSK